MASTFLNLSTDTTLGGNSPSDSVAVSQKAIKTYVDNNSGGGSSYTAGTGIDITNDVISVTAPTLTNTATASSSLTIGGQSAVYGNIVNIGNESYCDFQGGTALGSGARVYGYMGTVIGYGSYAFGDCSIAIGSGAIISNTVTKPTIQIGRGTNSEEYTLYVGFGDSVAGTSDPNYKLLDGATGLIPSARIDSETTSEVTLSTVATSGLYSDLSGTPTIPTVNNATLTITQGGVTKGTFTANASSDVTIALDSGGGSTYTAGNGIDITNGTISVKYDNSTITLNSSGQLQAGIEAYTANEVETLWESI